jgi:hypothetical protein
LDLQQEVGLPPGDEVVTAVGLRLRATAELVRWTMAHAETHKLANAVVKHPAVRAVLQGFAPFD